MQLETKFGIGDSVYHVTSYSKPVYQKCALCMGVGVVDVAHTTLKAVCPLCNGQKDRYLRSEEAFMVSGPFVVGLVRKIITHPEHVDNWHPADDEEYMLTVTGIHTGTVYNGRDLFATKQECEDALTARQAAYNVKLMERQDAAR